MLPFGNLIRRLNFESKFARLSACFLTLICMVCIGKGVIAYAASDSQAANTAAGSSPANAGEAPPAEKGKLTDFSDGDPTINLTGDNESDNQKYRLPKDVAVEINGIPSKLSDLKPGDDCTITKDAKGNVTKISATRTTAGIIVDFTPNSLVLSSDMVKKETYQMTPGARVLADGKPASVDSLVKGDDATLLLDNDQNILKVESTHFNLFAKFWNNFRSNLFKPLLLFFYVGFCIPLMRVAFDFPKAIYQGLTIYLLVSIGWHGGEELAMLSSKSFNQAFAFMIVGFLTNAVIALLAYGMLRLFVPKLRKVDAATCAAYYGSDSAGTFVTCLGVLQAAHVAAAAYMPVMLAIMEIPGCLVGLLLVNQLRVKGMDRRGNMPDEPNYKPRTDEDQASAKKQKWGHVFHEIFFNPGSFLLFGGIFIGYVSRLQGLKVVQQDDAVFISLFQGFLCLFLLEMGMTASRRLADLRSVNWTFIAFGLVAPNIFALFGMAVAQVLSHALHQPFQLGTYTLFAVLCAAASYIAVPAVQRLAIPEASPSLPLAASLGLTFSYNVTVGIPLYMLIAQILMRQFPVS
ncbi:MAG: sodium-dependent bicarbonate transport family permease [Candidatus Obscuribacterales bacterium]